ncbi:uncharacterized protein EAF01_012057 [Botrytis porri]|uniref:Exonuclease domain-containing protein n=1 Tax=Botrytis porri TaxID=87229 RepID=A0A4Z1KAR5_9HELO|nr:uncharacterized protein EAF01_012057 [Botrytis porri]KAF7880162.1 hypothetical protein EAF01_012057 [Botrytis porri]TGO80632.1 hypothetical protein BPOR_1731g00010 [Botrytis porri]
MSAYCSLCQRSFKDHKSLDQHVNNSSVHRNSIQGKSNVSHSVGSNHTNFGQTPYQQAKPSQSIQMSYGQHNGASSYLNHTVPGADHQLLTPIISTYTSTQVPSFTVAMIVPVVKSLWSTFHESESQLVLATLSSYCHSREDLQSNNYITQPYNKSDYVDSRKCKRCNGKFSMLVRELRVDYEKPCTFHPYKRKKWNVKKPYKCCWINGSEPDAHGCQTLPIHDFQFPLRSFRHQDFQQTPAASNEPKYLAVVIDCEMAGVASDNGGEPILLCAVDFVSGAVILNHLIYPKERINDMRSSIHGISINTLNEAASRGQALDGWEEARSKLWELIDANTILIGHALENDLDALRIIHPRIVDSAILAKKEVGFNRNWGLSTMCSEILKLEIRKNKGAIHDCLEDVLATREVVICCTQNKDAFQNWAKVKETEETKLKKEREEKREISRKKKQEECRVTQDN